PLDLAEAIRNLRTGTAEMLDVGTVNGRVFVNNSNLGLYPRLVYLRNAQQKRGRGKWIGFVKAALVTFRRFPFLRVRLEAGGHSIERKTPFVFIGNNEYKFEGLRIGSRQRLNDGHLCVSVAQRVGRWGVLRLVIRALLGRLTEDRDFIMLSTKSLWVATRKKLLPVSIDGEVVLMQAPLQYKIHPGALRVIVPLRRP
ncbi:MAG: diacylglycerol/lipid kinase family protein, partial [Bryobacteraceae bacterium]